MLLVKIMNRRLKLIFQILRYLPQNLYINFHYLPFKQAWKIPIMVWKPKFRRLQGEIQILGGGYQDWNDQTWFQPCIYISQ